MSALTARERLRAASERVAGMSSSERSVMLIVLVSLLAEMPGGAHLMTVAGTVEHAVEMMDRKAAETLAAARRVLAAPQDHLEVEIRCAREVVADHERKAAAS